MSLGKGLGALITSTNNRKTVKKGQLNDAPKLDNTKIWQIPLDSISPDPNQPRKNFPAKELQELANSIKEHGVLQPILVTEKANGNYEIISGERRYRASRLAGLADVPAVVKKLAKQQQLEVALIENIQRQDLNPLEEAFAYQRLIEEFGLTQKQVADKVGKGRSTIANMVRILALPTSIKEALTSGKINLGQAKVLLSLDSDEMRLEMLSSMMGEKITVQELTRSVAPHASKSRKKARNPNLVYLEEKLQTALGTRVAISNHNGKGKIIINFYSQEELKELTDKLL